MSAKPAASPDDIEMSSVFGALKRSAKTILLSSVALGGLTFAVLGMMAPRYQSQAELTIAAKGPTVLGDPKSANAGPDVVTTKMDQAAINTHVRALQSADLLSKIADELDLKKRPEFNAAVGPVDKIDAMLRLIGLGGPRAGESTRDRVLSQFRNQLEVYAAKESRLIGVRMQSTDPALAADIANKLVDSYRVTLATQGVTEVDDQQAVLKGKIDKLLPEVAAAETEVDRYRGEINSYKGSAQTGTLDDQQRSELTAELTRAKATRGEAEARAKSAREMMKLGSADAQPDVQKSPLIQNLVQQRVRIERQISELSASLLPGHPRMQQLNADLAGLKRQLNGEIGKLVDSLEKEARVAQGREDAIKKSLEDIKTRVVENAPEEAKLRQIEASVKAKRTELENLQAQLEANRKKLDTRSQAVEVQSTAKAQPSSVPVFPKKGPMSGLVSLATMLLGIAWTVTKALFAGARGGSSNQGRRATDNSPAARAEPRLAASTVAATKAPAAAAVAAAAGPVVATAAANSVGSETSIDALARRVTARRPASGGHRTLVTGETASVDATEEAVALAKAIAANGVQTVVVEWSPSGQGSPKLGTKPGTPGLTELLGGSVKFDDIVGTVPGSTVHFIASGASLDSLGDDVDPEQINLVLDALDEAYDFIVVVGAHEDARLLFEVIQGRFDASVMVADGKKRASVLQDPEGTFLGFEVADIDVIRFERTAAASPVSQRIVRATRNMTTEARPL